MRQAGSAGPWSGKMSEYCTWSWRSLEFTNARNNLEIGCIVYFAQKSIGDSSDVLGIEGVHHEMAVELVLVGKPHRSGSLPSDEFTAAIACQKSSSTDSFRLGTLPSQDSLQCHRSRVTKVDRKISDDLSDLRVNLQPILTSLTFNLVENGVCTGVLLISIQLARCLRLMLKWTFTNGVCT